LKSPLPFFSLSINLLLAATVMPCDAGMVVESNEMHAKEENQLKTPERA
jgi:hypothetical protein